MLVKPCITFIEAGAAQVAHALDLSPCLAICNAFPLARMIFCVSSEIGMTW